MLLLLIWKTKVTLEFCKTWNANGMPMDCLFSFQIPELKEIILIGFYQSSESLSKFISSAQQEFNIPIRYFFAGAHSRKLLWKDVLANFQALVYWSYAAETSFQSSKVLSQW